MKIGIYGGTFDPPHIGHIKSFEAFVKRFDFDKVYVIPASIPPHKSLKSKTTADDRLNMTRLAFEGIAENVVVSDLEMNRQGKSYTADTIKHFKENGCDEIYFLCGTDMFLTLDMWYKPEYIFENAIIVFARRENEHDISLEIKRKEQEYVARFNARILPLEADAIIVSSTEIRDDIGKDIYNLLSADVAKYIASRGLYKEGQNA